MTSQPANFYSYRSRDYETEDGPWDPISGGASALLGTIASLTMGVADMPIEIFKAAKTRHTAKTQRAFPNSGEKGEKTSSSSGEDTPQDPSRSQSSLDLGLEETTEPNTYTDPTSPLGSTPKTSYESTLRSSTETRATDTPLTSSTSLGEHRSGSLRQALRGTLDRARSRSRDRGSWSRSNSKDRQPGSRTGSPFRREQKEFDPSKLTLDNAVGAAKGVQRIVAAGMKSPMDFTLGIARGFHNAPKLYGDDTVRPSPNVTDFQSGIKAATKVSSFEH
jgi:hypothetical protein